MFLRDKLCHKKIFFSCLFLVLSFFFSISLSSPVSAASLAIDHLNFSYKPTSSSSDTWSPNLAYGVYLNSQGYWYSSDGFLWTSAYITPSGNYADVHFETNVVLSNPQNSAWYSSFVNRSFLRVISCSGSSSGRLSIKSSNVSSRITDWVGPAPTITYKNQTLTVYGDVTLVGFDSSNQTVSCYVGSSYPFAQTSSSSSASALWFEQSPTSINFYTDNSDAIGQAQVDAINNVSTSIYNSDEAEQQRWETDRQEQADKETELKDLSDDLSLSAQSPSDPFSDLFPSTNTSSCRDLTTIGRWFGNAQLRICSPYTATFTNIANFVTASVVFMLVVRVYIKHLKGGVDG